MIFQEPMTSLNPLHTIEKQINETLILHKGMDRDAARKRTLELLNLVGIPEAARRLSAYPHELSGGQRQRVAIGRAIVREPAAFLFDEPLSNLDAKLRTTMRAEITKLHRALDATFIYVTHDQEEALTMSDRIAVMQNGQILQVGTPKDIYNRPARRFVADFIGDINIFEAELADVADGRGEVTLPGGARLSAHLSDRTIRAGRVSVAVRPEYLRLVAADDAAATMTGTVENVVYFGSGSNVHITLDDGTQIVARAAGDVPHTGERAGLVIPEDRLQVLVD